MATGEYTTQRGFSGYASFIDSYGAEVRVQDSSAASDDKVWVFVSGGSITNNDDAAHLSVEQARALRDGLDEFIARHS